MGGIESVHWAVYQVLQRPDISAELKKLALDRRDISQFS